MNVVKDWETLVSDLKTRVQDGDLSCRPLLEKAQRELNQARSKERDRCGHGR